jgi:cob(I)alamin adenosyltransferase
MPRWRGARWPERGGNPPRWGPGARVGVATRTPLSAALPTTPAAADPDPLDREAAELGPGGELAPERDQEAYRRRMARRQEVQRQRVGERNREKGLVLVFTGEGKGKTTAALGLVLRTLGHGDSVAVVQFIKGGWQPGEARALELFGDALAWHALGEGFTWETQDRERDRALVQQAWERSCAYLADGNRRLVVLDEVNVALKLGYLAVEQVLEGLALRPELTHVALTGRGAPPALLERADLVTEMKLVRHPFREQGVKAQRGIEF